jgi:hypothetical protein
VQCVYRKHRFSGSINVQTLKPSVFLHLPNELMTSVYLNGITTHLAYYGIAVYVCSLFLRNDDSVSETRSLCTYTVRYEYFGQVCIKSLLNLMKLILPRGRREARSTNWLRIFERYFANHLLYGSIPTSYTTTACIINERFTPITS